MKTKQNKYINLNFSLQKLAKAVIGASFIALLGMTTAASAQVAAGTTGIDATGSARSEAAACNNGTSQQDRETCMTEVRNANAAKRAGKLDGSSTQLGANAMQRCNVLSGEDKIACEARIVGYGSTNGSVAGGGVIREVETVVVPADAQSVTIEPKTSSGNIVVIPASQ
jgi:hypothetical protein